MASYAAISGMDGLIFIPEGKIAFGKLSQALAYGARLSNRRRLRRCHGLSSGGMRQ